MSELMEGNRISAWDSVLKGYCATANKTNRKSGKEDLEGRAGSGGVRKFAPGGGGGWGGVPFWLLPPTPPAISAGAQLSPVG